MVYAVAALAVVAAWLVAARAGLVAPVGRAVVVLRVRNGRVDVVRGVLARPARDLVADALARGGVARAFVQVRHDGRVRFSGRVSEGVQQQVRNILRNT